MERGTLKDPVDGGDDSLRIAMLDSESSAGFSDAMREILRG
jgi:hypothetical protein